MLNCLNIYSYIHSSYHLDDQKYENDQLQRNSSDIGQVLWRTCLKRFKLIKFDLQLMFVSDLLLCFFGERLHVLYMILRRQHPLLLTSF